MKRNYKTHKGAYYSHAMSTEVQRIIKRHAEKSQSRCEQLFVHIICRAVADLAEKDKKGENVNRNGAFHYIFEGDMDTHCYMCGLDPDYVREVVTEAIKKNKAVEEGMIA